MLGIPREEMKTTAPTAPTSTQPATPVSTPTVGNMTEADLHRLLTPPQDPPAEVPATTDVAPADPEETPTTTAEAEPAEATEESVEETTQPEAKTEAKPTREERRWNELTAKLKEKDAEIARLKGQDAPKAEEPAPRFQPTTASHPELAKADQALQQTEALLAWVDENPEGGEIQLEKGPREVSAAEVRSWRTKLTSTLARQHGEKAALVARLEQDRNSEFQRNQVEAVKVYPWLAQKDSPEMEQALDIVQELKRDFSPQVFNELMTSPRRLQLIGAIVTGRKSRDATPAATKPVAKPAARPTPQPGAPSAKAPAVNADDQIAKAKAEFERTGSDESLRRMLKATDRRAQPA
jgi:hypothetical protein